MNLTTTIKLTGNKLIPMLINVYREDGTQFANFMSEDEATRFFIKHFGIESREYADFLLAYGEFEDSQLRLHASQTPEARYVAEYRPY